MKDTILKRLRDECNNYDQTVQALKAVAHELLWDDAKHSLLPNATAYFGRRMWTSAQNRITKSAEITPDLVVRREDGYGAVTEAKITLPRDPKRLRRDLIELQKYDDDLRGWDTADEKLPSHDLIVIVGHFIGRAVTKHIVALRRAKKFKPVRPFALITFGVMEMAAGETLSLELRHGHISDDVKQRKLAQGALAIQLSNIVGDSSPFGRVQLYDHPPPFPILMNLVHEIVNQQLTKDERHELMEKNEVRKAVTVASLREELARQFGPGEKSVRVPEIPKPAWVRQAMQLFVRLRWAKAVEGERDSYTYFIRRRRAPLRQFQRLWIDQQTKRIRQEERRRNKEKKDLPLYFERIQKERAEKDSTPE